LNAYSFVSASKGFDHTGLTVLVPVGVDARLGLPIALWFDESISSQTRLRSLLAAGVSI